MASRKRTGKGEEWSCGVIALPAYVTGEDPAYRPEVIVWAGARGEVLAYEMKPAADALVALVESFEWATTAPMAGRPRVPARVRVESPGLAKSLGAALAGKTRVVCAPTPDIDAVVGGMHEFMALHPQSAPSYLGGGVDAEAVAAFFDAAAALFRAAPWKLIPGDTRPLSVTIEELDLHDFVLSVIGQMGESRGLVLLSDLERYEAYLAAGADPTREDDPNVVPPHFFVAYDRGADMDPALRKEIAAHGWPVAGPGAYPWCASVDEDLVACPPDATELAMAEAILRGLTDALADKKAIRRACSGGEPFEHTCQVPTHAGPLTVTLRLPYSVRETPDLLGALASLANDGTDTGRRQRLEHELFERFKDSPEASALERPELLGVVSDLAAVHHHETLATIQPAQLEHTLIDLVPRQIGIEPWLARPLVDELRALFAFMYRALDWKRVARLLDLLDDSVTERLELALDQLTDLDPTPFDLRRTPKPARSGTKPKRRSARKARRKKR